MLAAAAAMGAGRLVALIGRDGEGDLVMAAQFAEVGTIAFFVSNTSGMIGVAMPEHRCDELDLPPMTTVVDGSAVSAVTVDASPPIGTGISARDRARTIRVLASPTSVSGDLSRPGHVLPWRVDPDGVLRHPGRLAACVDLCRIAGIAPAAVRAELLSADGSVSRGTEVHNFAASHSLPVVTVDQVVAYRRRFGELVRRESDCRLLTPAGAWQAIGYQSPVDGGEHVALVLGDLQRVDAPLVRVHRECIAGDVFGSLACDCRQRLNCSLEAVKTAGSGAVIYLRGHQGHGTGLTGIGKPGWQDPTSSPDYSIAAAILRDLGIHRFRALVGGPVELALSGELGLEIVRSVPFPAHAGSS